MAVVKNCRKKADLSLFVIFVHFCDWCAKIGRYCSERLRLCWRHMTTVSANHRRVATFVSVSRFYQNCKIYFHAASACCGRNYNIAGHFEARQCRSIHKKLGKLLAKALAVRLFRFYAVSARSEASY